MNNWQYNDGGRAAAGYRGVSVTGDCVDGAIHDLDDCSRDGTRCVYGYYSKDGGQ